MLSRALASLSWPASSHSCRPRTSSGRTCARGYARDAHGPRPACARSLWAGSRPSPRGPCGGSGLTRSWSCSASRLAAIWRSWKRTCGSGSGSAWRIRPRVYCRGPFALLCARGYSYDLLSASKRWNKYDFKEDIKMALCRNHLIVSNIF